MNRTLESPEVRWRMDLERRASEAEEAARALRFVRHVQSQSQEPKAWDRAKCINVIAVAVAAVVLVIILVWSEYAGW